MKVVSNWFLRLALSAAVSLLVLAFLMHLVPGAEETDQPRLLEVLRGTALGFIALYLLCALGQGWLRAVRYRLLIAAGNEPGVPGLWRVSLVTFTRNMLVDLLPARVGELGYIAMLNRGYRVSGAVCVSSLGISFIFDFIALLLIIVLLLIVQILAGALQGWLIVAAVMAAVAVLIMLAAVFRGVDLVVALLQRLPDRLRRTSLVRPLLAFLQKLAAAIGATRRARVMTPVLGLSVGVRVIKYTGLYVAFLGVAAPAFPDLADVSFGTVLTALLSAEAGASLPVPAFMSFGTYEAGGTLALTLLGFPVAASRVIMLAVHIWSQLVDYSLGGIALAVFCFSAGAGGVRAAFRARAAGKRPAALRLLAAGLALGLVLAGLAGVALERRRLRKMGAVVPPESGQALQAPPAGRRRLERTAAGLRGRIVWSSNRFGNHEIVSLSLPDLTFRRLTDHPHVDYFARVSPDGRRIVFSRSQVAWVSQRNPVPWDVYLLDLETGAESRVARNGNTPTWSADGQTVYFQRDGGRFVAHELATGQERVLFAAGREGLPEGVELQTPHFNAAAGALAVTLRGALRATVVIWEDGRHVRVGGGCQLTWTGRGTELCYVDKGGRQKNVIYGYDLESRERTPWLDLPGDLSHEYFPAFSAEARWMVFGASGGGRHGHEHDTADYEIFLWRRGTPADEAVRVTFHTGN
ncbi:MAG: flippase-like domain-containing protein, partial [Lentisphaerae bacterium]|nr:flippase-like domain-containing protein [Lentisphaerota bacterium]